MKYALAVLLVTGCSHTLTAKQFSMKYAREGKAPAAVATCRGISRISVRDPRKESKLVGDRSRDDDPTLYAVTTTSNVSGWIREGLEAQAKEAQLPIGDIDRPALEVTVNVADLHERVGGRGDYKARISLDVIVMAADGQACFQGIFEGEGKNLGSDGEGANYAQTFNRALDAAAVSLYESPTFREILCLKCGASR